MTTTIAKAAAKSRPWVLSADEAKALAERVAALASLTTPELRLRYAEAFGERTTSRNRVYLQRRIAWRMQEQAYGGLSERAARRAEELARDTDLRVRVPKMEREEAPMVFTSMSTAARASDRLPPGRVLTRDYNGRRYEVKVLEHGFQYAGEVYPSLSAIANKITGGHWSGHAFFRLRKRGGKR